MDTSPAESTCVPRSLCSGVPRCPHFHLAGGKGRTYEIRKETVTCSFCEAGCKFDLNYKAAKSWPLPNAPGEGRPLCLKELGMELRHVDKPVTPMLKKETISLLKFPA